MINLRYHIVSITAVFLALGIGTALGGTFLDRYTVDVLDRNIRSAEARISDTEAQNARLETQIGDANARNDALIQTGSAALFAGQLEDLPVLIVTSEGIDPDVVSNLRMSLVRADADVRGTLELRDSLDLADGVDADVAKAVDADPSDPDAVRSAVYSDLRRAFYLAGRPAEEKGKGEQEGTGGTTTTVAPPVATTAPVPSLPTPSLPAPTTTAPVPNAGSKKTSEELPDGKQPEIVTTLLDNDLLRLTPGPGRSTDDPILEQRGYRYVFVGGPNLDPVASRIMLALLPTPARRAIPAVVVSPTVPPVTDGGSEGAPTVVALIRASSERAPVYSTVDGVDTFAGLTAAVLTVRDTGTGEVGHYGQAAGASGTSPRFDVTATESPGPVDPTDSSSEGAAPHGTLRRATTTITIWNLVSRLTGFVRVMATASALGIAVLGDTYQRTNQVSNVLFELLAGGMLFSVLVPSFVDELRLGEREGARSLAGALTLRGVAVMGVLVTAGMVLASPISDLLTASADQSTRQTQADLGAFLLLFILPQLVFYVIGAVASGLLQADHRFAAVSAAPALNNLVVIATMITFRVVHDPARGLHLTTGEKVLLGGGTLLGTVAMTVVPLLALRPAGLGMRLRWRVDHGGLGALARRGLWGAGHVGLNQILVLTTIVLAGEVRGGVIAYQTAFTFFLLPHALLAHPIFTALFPRLARHGSARRRDLFADDLGRGLRSITFLVLPATALMAVVTPPALSVVRFGQFDAAGSRLVALVLSAYLLGLVGYSTFFLMTRASYALDEARLPTLVNLAVTASAVLGMVLIAGQVDGNGVLVGFGVVTSITSIGGAVYLTLAVKRRLGTAVRASASVIRTTVSSAAGAAGGFATVSAIGWDSTPHALLSVVTGGLVVAAVTATVLKLVGSEELPTVAGRVRSLFAKVGIG